MIDLTGRKPNLFQVGAHDFDQIACRPWRCLAATAGPASWRVFA
jgi:hypothetical protein